MLRAFLAALALLLPTIACAQDVDGAPGWRRLDPHTWARTDIPTPAAQWRQVDAHRWTLVP